VRKPGQEWERERKQGPKREPGRKLGAERGLERKRERSRCHGSARRGRTPAPVDELGTADGMWMGGLIVGASGSPAPRRCCIHCAGALNAIQTAA